MGIFEPYRALGYVTDGTPFSVQRRGTENFVTVSVGKAWQIYNVSISFSIWVYCASLCFCLHRTEGAPTCVRIFTQFINSSPDVRVSYSMLLSLSKVGSLGWCPCFGY